MSSRVRCGRCGAVYETEAPPEAIREINRCRECGGPLAIDQNDDDDTDEPQPGRAALA